MGGGPLTDNVVQQELPARDYAVARHRGPHHRISETYLWLFGAWLPVSGREAASAPALEYARNDLRVTPQAKFGLFYSGELASTARDHAETAA